MQDRPTATELLSDIAELLDERVVAALDGSLRHEVRVAANLCRIIERELRLAASSAGQEVRVLRDVLGVERGDVDELNERLAAELRDGAGEDLQRAAWEALVEIARAKLAMTKPGYDAEVER